MEEGAAVRCRRHLDSRGFSCFLYSAFLRAWFGISVGCEVRARAPWICDADDGVFALSEEGCVARRFYTFQLLQFSHPCGRINFRYPAFAMVPGIFHVFLS